MTLAESYRSWMVDAGSVLAGLADEVLDRFGSSVTVRSEEVTDRISTTSIEPARPGALSVSWVLMGDQEIVLNAGRVGGHWEVLQEPQNLTFVRDLIFSVAAGRVMEIFGPGRSQVEVTLADAAVVTSTGYQGAVGSLPAPGWRRRGRRVTYQPW